MIIPGRNKTPSLWKNLEKLTKVRVPNTFEPAETFGILREGVSPNPQWLVQEGKPNTRPPSPQGKRLMKGA